MGRVDELLSAEFAQWEQGGRGWQVWPHAVRPEPAFREFTGYRIPESQLEVDDSRRPGLLASFFDSLHRRLNPAPSDAPKDEPSAEPEPMASEAGLANALVASLPAKLDLSDESLGSFLDSLHGCAEPTAFEILGRPDGVTIQFCSSTRDAPLLQRQLSAFLPEVAFVPAAEELSEAWNNTLGDGLIVDFGLAQEFLLPLETRHSLDPFIGLVAVLSELRADEVAVLQVLFQPVQHPWPASLWRSVTDANGKALFHNRLELLTGVKSKVETPLFGVVLRVAAKAESFDRSVAIVREVAETFRVYGRSEGNRLIPLHNEDYPFAIHEADLIERQSRRSGMLLNRDELLGFVHLPADEVHSSKLRRERIRTRAAPSSAPSGLLFGQNQHAGRTAPVFLSAEQRVRHTYVIGASGTGKSSLLLNLIRQDLAAGQGLALLDPHGDLVESVLRSVPEDRIDDVIFFDPSDEEYSVGFNILSAHSDFEKNLLASDLVAVFRRLSSSWGDQLNSVLGNAIRAFLESSRGGTLSDLRRFLIDAKFRQTFLDTVSDPEVVYYWRKSFPQLGGNKSVGPVLTRLEAFLGPKPIRYCVSQKENRLDFAHILDHGKIFLAKLSHGDLGSENAFLLGSLLMAKFQQMAMSRQRLSRADRRDFWLYLDEFQNFITPSMAEILSGARKYRLGLILAHQELQQLERDREVASAVLSNCCTRAVFRVGDTDARKLAEGFAHYEARDLQNLEPGRAVSRIERSDHDFNLSVSLPPEGDLTAGTLRRNRIVQASREKYAIPRVQIEEALRAEIEQESVELEQEERAAPKRPAKVTAKVAASPPIVSPKPSEAPVAVPAAVSAVEPAPAPLEEPVAKSEPANHQELKNKIAHQAEALGYTVTIEEEVPKGGRIDLVLRRGGKTIACELTIQNAVNYEVGNICKCLTAGHAHIVVPCLDSRKVERIQAVWNALPKPEGKYLVEIRLLADFLKDLEKWAKEDVRGGIEEKAKLRKRSFDFGATKLSDAERREREKELLRQIKVAMQSKPT